MTKHRASAEKPVRHSETSRQPRTVRLLPTICVTGLIAVIAFVGGARLQQSGGFSINNPLQGPSGQLQLSALNQTYALLKDKFAESGVDPSKLVDGAQHGLVSSLGDPYTVYFSADEAKQFDSDLNGTFSGIGAELSQKDKSLIVQSVLDDSPAKKSGLQTGDIIAKVNDQDTNGWSVDKAVTQIRGDAGTTVKLAIIRSGAAKEYSLTRALITNPSVRYSIENGIGYLRITRFAQNDTTTLARKAAEEFKAKGVRGVVLDVRDNGGGYVTAAQDVASLWLGPGKTVVSERRDGKTIDTLQTDGNAILQDVPTVVLINGGTASASEIVAGALHDYKAAQLVGVKSFGKGSVQEVLSLNDGAELKVTVALWYTPNGKNINKQGIQPDVTAELSEQDAAAGNDTQKTAALNLLNR